MVHALQEIHRTLIPDGILIDLRPLADRWPVEIVSRGEVHGMGRLTDLPTGLADDDASNNTMEDVSQRGWFIREEEEFFYIYLYWDNPEEVSAQMTERWSDFVKLEDETLEAIQAAWKTAGEDKRIRVKTKMLLTRWRKK